MAQPSTQERGSVLEGYFPGGTGPKVGFRDGFEDLLAMNLNLPGGLDPEPHTVPADGEYLHLNPPIDDNGLVELTGDDQHQESPRMLYRKG